MNSIERVHAAFSGEPPDSTPLHHLGFSSDVASALLRREAYVGGGIQQWREATALWHGPNAHQEFLERSFQDALDIAMYCEHDIIRANYWRYATKPTSRLDETTFLYEYGSEDEWRVLRYDPPSEQCNIYPYRAQKALTLDDLESVVARQEQLAEDYSPNRDRYDFEIRAHELLGDRYVIRVNAVHLNIPTEAAWLEATMLRPDLVERLLDTQVERARRNVEFLSSYGFSYFFGGGDLASNDGPMYSPRTFRKLLVPRLKEISETCHQHQGRHLFASDGDLWPIADDLFGETGVDGYVEVDARAGMALGALRDRYPHLTLVGNISSHTVAQGTPDQIAAEAHACLDEAQRRGRIIVGASNYFVPGTPVENVERLLQVLCENR